MEKSEFKALVEQYKNEMIELFNLKKDIVNDAENRPNDTIEQISASPIVEDNQTDKNDIADGLDDTIKQTSVSMVEDNQTEENELNSIRQRAHIEQETQEINNNSLESTEDKYQQDLQEDDNL